MDGWAALSLRPCVEREEDLLEAIGAAKDNVHALEDGDYTILADKLAASATEAAVEELVSSVTPVPSGVFQALDKAGIKGDELVASVKLLLFRERDSTLPYGHILRLVTLYLTLMSGEGASSSSYFCPILLRKVCDLLRRASSAAAGSGKRKRNDGENEDGGESDPEDVQEWRCKAVTALGAAARSIVFRGAESRLHMIEIVCALSRDVSLPASTLDEVMSALAALIPNASSSVGGRAARHEVLAQVFSELLPSIVMTFSPPNASSIPRPVGAVRRRALELVCKALEEDRAAMPRADDRSETEPAGQSIEVGDDNHMATEDEVPSSARSTDALEGHFRALLHNICIRTIDKADYREKTAEAVIDLLECATSEERARFISFLSKFSKNAKISYRHLAIDLAVALILNSSAVPDEVSGEADLAAAVSNFEKLGSIVRGRACDKSPVVRSRAVVHISTILQAAREGSLPEYVNESFYSCFIDGELVSAGTAPPADAPCTPSKGMAPPAKVLHIRTLLHRRTTDEKSAVRKAATQGLQELIHLEAATGGIDHTGNLEVGVVEGKAFRACCMDSAVSNRKQGIASLTELLSCFPRSSSLQELWVGAVLPLAMDPEVTVAERACESFEATVLSRASSPSSSDESVWGLLARVDSEGSRYVQHLCATSAAKKNLKPGATKVFEGHCRKELENEGAWILLTEMVAKNSSTASLAFVRDMWAQVRPNLASKGAKGSASIMPTANKQRFFRLLGLVAARLETEERITICDEIFALLAEFSMEPAVIQTSVECLGKLCRENEGGSSILEKNCRSLMEMSEKALYDYVFTSRASPASDALISRHLFTIGEVALVNVKVASQRVVTIVQALISSELQLSGAGEGSSKENKENSSPRHVEPSVRAHALLSLGKLCLSNESLAKRSVTAFMHELETSTDAAVRNNVLVVLCDLCKRYTLLVERYVPRISLCLRDPNEVVRKNSLMLLAQLLQEDFLKWKDGLFFKFVAALVDPAESVRQYARYCIMVLKQRKGTSIFHNHFVESFFFFNSYTNHPVYNQFTKAEREDEVFSMKGAGESDRRRRMEVYDMFLQHLNDEQKFNVTARMVQDVLGSFVDGVVPLDGAEALLTDVLAVLGSKEIKVGKTIRAVAEDDEATPQQAAEAAATHKILTKVVKKNVIENIVPVVVELKHLLERKHSPILGALMHYLRELMKDYKEELSDVLAADPQLAAEIKYDIQRYEEDMRRTEQINRESLGGMTAVPSPSLLKTPAKTPRPSSLAPRTPKTPGVAPIRMGDLTPAMTPKVKAQTPKTAGSPMATSPSPAKEPMEVVVTGRGSVPLTDITNDIYPEESIVQAAKKQKKAGVTESLTDDFGEAAPAKGKQARFTRAKAAPSAIPTRRSTRTRK